MNMKKLDRSAITEVLLPALVAAWLFAAAFVLLFGKGDFTAVNFYKGSTVLWGILFVGVGAPLCLWGIVARRKGQIIHPEQVALLASATVFAAITAWVCENMWVSVACALGLCLVGVYVRSHIGELTEQKDLFSVPLLCVFTVAAACLMAAVPLARYASYKSPTFDFGIFAEMFDSMAKTGLPQTTLERDVLLSHFSVHFSPTLYLLLPFYWLVPRPETLLVLQGILLASAAVPMWLMAKEKTGSRVWALVFALAVLLYPALSGGVTYDFHENKLLPALLLWFLYFAEKKKNIPALIFLLCVLGVKEDAAVYTACIGLYWTAVRREYARGAAVFGISLLWFGLAVVLLSRNGEGPQVWRYENISDSGLIGIVHTCIVNPARVLKNCFTEGKPEFIVYMLAPLAGLPLLTKRPGRLILLIPFLLVNLMTDYEFQHSIWFQYAYGSGTLLLYAALCNAADTRLFTLKNGAVLRMVLIGCSLVMFLTGGQKLNAYITDARDNKNENRQMTAALAEIPENATVCASTMLTAHLADRAAVFNLDRTFSLTQYVALDLRCISAEEAESQLREYEEKGYSVQTLQKGVIAVLRSE